MAPGPLGASTIRARDLVIAGVFVAMMVVLYLTSTLYHALPRNRAKRVRYSHFVWHLFVIAGTACHCIAVLRYAA